MSTVTVPISQIKIKNRTRKDYGNISELAESIKQHGLLQPIVITPDNILIAGERRIKAVQNLGLDTIEAVTRTICDREEQLLCEIAENEKRKDFTPSERVAYGQELERIESLKAKERKLSGVEQTLSSAEDKVVKSHRGHTDRIVGKKVGMSESSYYRAKKVVDSGDKEVIEKMDTGKIGIGSAYDKIKKPEKQKSNDKKTITPHDDNDNVDFSFLLDDGYDESEEDTQMSKEEEEFNVLLKKTVAEAELMQHFKEAISVPFVESFLTSAIKQKLKSIGDNTNNIRNKDRQALINVLNILKKIIKKGDESK